jgi:hypothetical protein
LSEPDLTHDRGIGLDGLVPVSVGSNCTSVEHRVFRPGARDLAQ